MKMHRVSAVSNAVIGSILLVGVLVFAFIIGQRHFARADMTHDQVFTLTPATKHVVASMDKYPLKISAYFSERLPKAYKPRIDWIRDLLEEYRAFGKGNVSLEFVDPGAPNFSQTEKDNVEKGYGVRPLVIQEQERDSIVELVCYLSIVVIYGDKHERVDLCDPKEPLLDSSGTLLGFEYALTREIAKLSQEEMKGVGVLADNSIPPPKQPDRDPGLGFRRINELLEKQYRVQSVELKRGLPVSDDISTLIVAKPKNLSEREAFEIDQFVMRGGRLIVFADRHDAEITQQGIKVKPIATGLESVLEAYGCKLGESLVGDVKCGTLGVPKNEGPFRFTQQVPYPFFPMVLSEGMAKDNPIVSRLNGLELPWASAITLDEERLKGMQVTKLVSTTPASWTSNDAPFTGEAPSAPSGARTGQNVLAAVAVGQFHSPFAGKPIPKPASVDTPKKPGEPDLPDSADEVEKKDAERQVIGESPETRVMVVGSATLVNDTFLTQRPTSYVTQTLVLNAVDWFTVGDELINLRTRQVSNPEIEDVSDSKKGLARWSNVFGLPIVLLFFWAVRRFLRGRAGATYISTTRVGA